MNGKSSRPLASIYLLIFVVMITAYIAIGNTSGVSIFRDSTGANANSNIVHSGTGTLSVNSQNAGSIALMTSNNSRLTIDNSGNVGIGTTSPQYALDVNAPARFGCPSGMLDTGAGFCIDSSDSAETAYGSGFETCAAAGKMVCSFQEMCITKSLNIGSLGVYYRFSDLMFWTGDNTHYFAGGTGSNGLVMPAGCNSFNAPGPHSHSDFSYRCCRSKG